MGQDFRAKITFSRGENLNKLISSKDRKLDISLESHLAERGYIIGTIDYGVDNLGKREYGILILVKSTLVDGLSLETRGYKIENPAFPNQPTADQFFDERQFEAYRELGFKIGTDMIEQAQLKNLIATVRV